MPDPAHIDWLVNPGKTITTADGHTVELWELKYGNDPAILSAWAKHFREHYCEDELRARREIAKRTDFPIGIDTATRLLETDVLDLVPPRNATLH